MSWSIRIKDSARKDLGRITKKERLRLVDAIDGLTNNPYRGASLKGDLTGLRRIRVGQYRIVYEIQDNELVVLVVAIGHRRDIYR